MNKAITDTATMRDNLVHHDELFLLVVAIRFVYSIFETMDVDDSFEGVWDDLD